MKILADGFAGSTKTVLNRLVVLAEVCGYLADLHAAIDVQAIDLTAVLRQTGKTVFQPLCDFLNGEDRLCRCGLLHAATADDVLILLVVSAATEIGYDQVVCGGID